MNSGESIVWGTIWLDTSGCYSEPLTVFLDIGVFDPLGDIGQPFVVQAQPIYHQGQSLR